MRVQPTRCSTKPIATRFSARSRRSYAAPSLSTSRHARDLAVLAVVGGLPATPPMETPVRGLGGADQAGELGLADEPAHVLTGELGDQEVVHGSSPSGRERSVR